MHQPQNSNIFMAAQKVQNPTHINLSHYKQEENASGMELTSFNLE